MRSSLIIIFLGWWLTRQRWMAKGYEDLVEGPPPQEMCEEACNRSSVSEIGGHYPSPSISVSPSIVFALGGNVTISCKSERHQQMEFYLHRRVFGSWQPPISKVAEKDEVTFPIANAGYSDEGTYTCIFKDSSQQWSSYSKYVYLKMREQFFPKPSISVIPNEVVAPGKTTTIRCNSEEYRGMSKKFSLIKEGALDIIKVETANKEEAVFSIASTGQSDAGIYWCDYRPISDHRYSFFSEKVYINITDLSFSKPSIEIRPRRQHGLGVHVTVLCRGPENGLTFFLHKSTDLRASQKTGPESNMTKFHVLKTRLEDAGSYTCQYHKRENPFVWSVPSEAAELVVRDASLSKPSIEVRSTEQTPSGFNVTIECQGPEMDLIFSLSRSMDPIATQAEANRTASFQVFMVELADAGHYACQYHRKGDPFVWSEPSDPLKLIKRDRFTIIMWASIAAGFLLLLFFLLLLTFKLCRKRRKGSTSEGPKQPVTMPLETVAEADPSEVSYAVLNPQSLKIKRAADPEIVSEPCVYASVANNRTRTSP